MFLIAICILISLFFFFLLDFNDFGILGILKNVCYFFFFDFWGKIGLWFSFSGNSLNFANCIMQLRLYGLNLTHDYVNNMAPPIDLLLVFNKLYKNRKKIHVNGVKFKLAHYCNFTTVSWEQWNFSALFLVLALFIFNRHIWNFAESL